MTPTHQVSIRLPTGNARPFVKVFNQEQADYYQGRTVKLQNGKTVTYRVEPLH